MKLLITGGCGFIGSNFVNYYFKQNSDATIVNLDAMYYCASETNVNLEVRESSRYHLIKGNLCSYDFAINSAAAFVAAYGFVGHKIEFSFFFSSFSFNIDSP